jgi:hypothetical protein
MELNVRIDMLFVIFNMEVFESVGREEYNCMKQDVLIFQVE